MTTPTLTPLRSLVDLTSRVCSGAGSSSDDDLGDLFGSKGGSGGNLPLGDLGGAKRPAAGKA
jgi:hypothetical protein